MHILCFTTMDRITPRVKKTVHSSRPQVGLETKKEVSSTRWHREARKRVRGSRRWSSRLLIWISDVFPKFYFHFHFYLAAVAPQVLSGRPVFMIATVRETRTRYLWPGKVQRTQPLRDPQVQRSSLQFLVLCQAKTVQFLPLPVWNVQLGPVRWL